MKIIFFLNDFLNQFLVRFSRQINGLLLILAHLVLLGLFFPRQRNSFGQLAINLLLIILFMSPLAQITRARLFMYLLRFRRPLGIAMAYAALVHFFGFVSDSIFFNYVFVQNWPHNFLNSWRLVFGVKVGQKMEKITPFSLCSFYCRSYSPKFKSRLSLGGFGGFAVNYNLQLFEVGGGLSASFTGLN
ncbi:MAG: hypothetical protein NTV81_02580 [Candidatus Komeilibacteria bacterium]|nr:hypothetical protein [Candidatus Komeilibacteria bacterium]